MFTSHKKALVIYFPFSVKVIELNHTSNETLLKFIYEYVTAFTQHHDIHLDLNIY